MKYIAISSGLLLATLIYGQAVQNASPVRKYTAKSSEFTQAPGPSGKAFVDRYCAGCHNEKQNSGGFSFAHIELSHPDQHAEALEKVILKLRTGMMPPAGAPRPNADVVKRFVNDLETRIDRAAAL